MVGKLPPTNPAHGTMTMGSLMTEMHGQWVVVSLSGNMVKSSVLNLEQGLRP